MANDRSFPVHVYKDGQEPRYAGNPKELKELTEVQGWTENYHNIPHQEYPRTMYNPDGHTRRVTSDAEREAAEADGFGIKAVAKVEVKPKVAGIAAIHESAGRMDALEERIDGIEGALGDILAELRGLKKPQRGRPAQIKSGDEE